MKKININYTPQLIEAVKNIEHCAEFSLEFNEAEHKLIQLIKVLIYQNKEQDIQKAINVLKHKNKAEAANKLFNWTNFISNNISVKIPEKNINALAMLVSIPVILFFNKNDITRINDINEFKSKIHESLKLSKLITEESDIFILPQLLSLKKASLPASAKRAIMEDMLKCLYYSENKSADIEYISELQKEFLKIEEQDDVNEHTGDILAPRWLLMVIVDNPENNNHNFNIVNYLDSINKNINGTVDIQERIKEIERNIEEILSTSCHKVNRVISGAPSRLDNAITTGLSMKLAFNVESSLQKIKFDKGLPIEILIFPKKKKEDVELSISMKQGDLVSTMELNTKIKDVQFDLDVVFVALISAGVKESDIKIVNSNIRPDQCYFNNTHQCYLQKGKQPIF